MGIMALSNDLKQQYPRDIHPFKVDCFAKSEVTK